MLMKQILRSVRYGQLRKVAFALIFAVTIIGVLPRVGTASMIPADEAIEAASMKGENVAKIQAMLERKEIAAKLSDYGLTPAEVSSRLDELTDAQAAEIAGQIDQVNAGGDAVGLLISIAVLVLLVLLILWILGYFPDASLEKTKASK